MKREFYRIPLLALAILGLLAALWGGWIRLGWQWPALRPTLPLGHGPLMVSSFLGTLIAVERAVALRQRWMYLGPALSGLGGLWLTIGLKGTVGPLLITLGSLGLVAIFYVTVRQHLTLYTAIMALGALAWLARNFFWLLGEPVYQVVFWWMSFLVLTVAGERLEIARLLHLSRRTQLLLSLIAGLILAGPSILSFSMGLGVRLTSLGFLGTSLWLLRFNIARYTIRQTGLPRFAALCLLMGYPWLGVGGILGVLYGAQTSGPHYDAILHTILVGFIFSMIFGHAPIIFPAVLGLPVNFSSGFYIHLGLLHLFLILRVAGDLLGYGPGRLWGGLLNGIAILIFLGATAISILQSRHPAPGQGQEKHDYAHPADLHR